MRVCVFCGSHSGNHAIFGQQAVALGKLLAQHQMGLVYGGANVGLMKMLAEAFMNEGGHAIGVIPHFLAEKHLVQPNLNETIYVDTMQERKILMAEHADAFVALPGGYGTLEELFEVVTASQLGLHSKPLVLANINGFYDHLLAHRDTMIMNGFVDEAHRNTIVGASDAAGIIDAIEKYTVPVATKYIEQVHEKYNGKAAN
jgi:uncharacterized protein (TIGR00730 family)